MTIFQLNFPTKLNLGSYWWVLRNLARNHVLGCDESGELRCRSRQVNGDGDLWHVYLLPAPGTSFFALKGSSRKRFAQTHSMNGERVQMDADQAWGASTLFQLHHLDASEYAIRTINGTWLRNDGLCESAECSTSELPVECLFAIEAVGNSIAFRDFRGLYLTGSASATLLKSKSDWASKDEQFELQPAPLQLKLRALFNNKWLSTRQGI